MPTPAAPCNNIYRRRLVPRGNGCAARGRVCPCARPRTRSPTPTTACSFTSLNHLRPPARQCASPPANKPASPRARVLDHTPAQPLQPPLVRLRTCVYAHAAAYATAGLQAASPPAHLPPARVAASVHTRQAARLLHLLSLVRLRSCARVLRLSPRLLLPH